MCTAVVVVLGVLLYCVICVTVWLCWSVILCLFLACLGFKRTLSIRTKQVSKLYIFTKKCFRTLSWCVLVSDFVVFSFAVVVFSLCASWNACGKCIRRNVLDVDFAKVRLSVQRSSQTRSTGLRHPSTGLRHPSFNHSISWLRHRSWKTVS